MSEHGRVSRLLVVEINKSEVASSNTRSPKLEDLFGSVINDPLILAMIFDGFGCILLYSNFSNALCLESRLRDRSQAVFPIGVLALTSIPRSTS